MDNADNTATREREAHAVDQLITALPGEWRFDHEVAQDFDQHVRRSVPLYDQAQQMIVEMSEWFVRDGMSVYDLGTSTGETIHQLQHKHAGKKDVRFVGIDNSLPMLEKARAKCGNGNVHFLHQNLTATSEFPDAGLVTALYTLQFLPVSERRKVLERVHRDLKEGGAILIVEKLRGESSIFEDIWLELYWDMKQRSGLNADQVLAKARSLRGVLVPLSVSENVAMLHDAGFACVDVFMKWYNFAGLIAIKMGRSESEVASRLTSTPRAEIIS
jgi:tRNA (cmo5U34)-methyltransferase